MKTTELNPLSWLNNFNKEYKAEVINWFNEKLDQLITKQDLMIYNNEFNYLDDIVYNIVPMIEVFIAPDDTYSDKEIEYFVSITEKKSDIGELTYIHCKNKFNKTI